jgi:catechol 2,3-dioxygenase-like lactoylglutathione lyase family enzyme
MRMVDLRGSYATIPATDLERARAFYRDKLGLEPAQYLEAGTFYQLGETWFALYPSTFAGTAQHTVIGFDVTDLERQVDSLRRRGVAFEEYDFPGLKTVNGIADLGDYRAAWFKDTEGNILMLAELARPLA